MENNRPQNIVKQFSSLSSQLLSSSYRFRFDRCRSKQPADPITGVNVSSCSTSSNLLKTPRCSLLLPRFDEGQTKMTKSYDCRFRKRHSFSTKRMETPVEKQRKTSIREANLCKAQITVTLKTAPLLPANLTRRPKPHPRLEDERYPQKANGDHRIHQSGSRQGLPSSDNQGSRFAEKQIGVELQNGI